MNFLQQNKIITYLFILIILALFLIISLSSVVYLYEKRTVILQKLGYYNHAHDHHNEERFLINPLEQSDRQIPPTNIQPTDSKKFVDSTFETLFWIGLDSSQKKHILSSITISCIKIAY